MRLIDADVLKNLPFERMIHTDFGETAIPIEEIDNTPTVFDCRSCKNNGNERECVDCHEYSNYVRYENRQHGEWVVDDWNKIIECNKCRGQAPIDITSGEQYESNFCPICGADMRKEADNGSDQQH